MFSPPAREASDQEALWQALALGDLQVISSDHAPYAYDKTGKLVAGKTSTFKQIPNGMPGLEARLPVVFDEMVSNGRFDVSEVRRMDLDQSGEDLRPLSEEGHARDRLGCRHRDLGPEEERHVRGQDREGPRRLHALEGPHREGLADHGAAARRGAGRRTTSCAPSPAADSSSRARPARPPSRSAAPRSSSTRSGISARSCDEHHPESMSSTPIGDGIPVFGLRSCANETSLHRRVALAPAALPRPGAGRCRA